MNKERCQPELKYEVPEIDIVSINQLRSENDGKKMEWSPVSSIKKPTIAPVRVNGSIEVINSLFKNFCRADKKTGRLNIGPFVHASASR